MLMGIRVSRAVRMRMPGMWMPGMWKGVVSGSFRRHEFLRLIGQQLAALTIWSRCQLMGQLRDAIGSEFRGRKFL